MRACLWFAAIFGSACSIGASGGTSDASPTMGFADDPSGMGDCTDDCVPGASECEGRGGVKACVRRAGECAHWSAVQSCGTGTVCNDGLCMAPEGTTDQANLYVGPASSCSVSAGKVVCDVSVCNGGAIGAAATTLKFFLDAPATAPECTAPSVAGERWLPLPNVPAGICHTESSVTMHDSPPNGRHRLALFADGLCQVPELDEADNYVVLVPDVMVGGAMGGMPDLWFAHSSSLTFDADAGELFGDIIVCNTGSAPTGAFYVDLFVDSSGPPSCGTAGDEFHSYPGLAAGACASSWLTSHFLVDTGFAKTAVVFVDSMCSVAESDEQNLWDWDYDL